MKRQRHPILLFFAVMLLAAGFVSHSAQAATLTIVNDDDPGEGFNDPTAVAAVPGNAGATLGQQRLNVFQAAADAWGMIVGSDVDIPIVAGLDPLPCSPMSGVLGGAGPTLFIAGGPVLGQVWHPFALANSLEGQDLSTLIGQPAGTPNIGATFNSDVDDDPNCLTGATWWYGIGAPAPAGTLDFFTTVLHEIGHGLGFTTAVDITTGAKLQGLDDVYMNNLEDHSSGMGWPEMSDAERTASAIDTGDLHWVGPTAVGQAGPLSAGTHPSGHVLMYAPNPLEQGSSVAHWDTTVTPNELMEPFLTPTAQDIITTALMQDIGWPLQAGNCIRNATTLCVDDEPGDRRFKVTLAFDTVLGGGLMGDAGATSLSSLGITKGGILSFTDPTNPEVLVKVLNGCAINGHYWVFYAATTTLGFDLVVEDTIAEMSKTYTNPDLMAAETITDTQAFATCP